MPSRKNGRILAHELIEFITLDSTEMAEIASRVQSCNRLCICVVSGVAHLSSAPSETTSLSRAARDRMAVSSLLCGTDSTPLPPDSSDTTLNARYIKRVARIIWHGTAGDSRSVLSVACAVSLGIAGGYVNSRPLVASYAPMATQVTQATSALLQSQCGG